MNNTEVYNAYKTDLVIGILFTFTMPLMVPGLFYLTYVTSAILISLMIAFLYHRPRGTQRFQIIQNICRPKLTLIVLGSIFILYDLDRTYPSHNNLVTTDIGNILLIIAGIMCSVALFTSYRSTPKGTTRKLLRLPKIIAVCKNINAK